MLRAKPKRRYSGETVTAVTWPLIVVPAGQSCLFCSGTAASIALLPVLASAFGLAHHWEQQR
jgi:histone acetyltransferase (RNA polymerase elongator complex component)